MNKEIRCLEQFGVDTSSGHMEAPFLYLLATVYQKIEKVISKQLASNNLSLTKFNILLLIRHKGGNAGLTQYDVVNRLLLSDSNVSRMMNSLYKEGYITRHEDPLDRRRKQLKITKKGTDLLDRVWPGFNQLMKETGELLPEKDRAKLVKILEKYFYALDNTKPSA